MTVLSSLFERVGEQEDGIIGILRREKIPTVFNYIGIKFCANRRYRAASNLSQFQGFASMMTQLSEIKFLDSQNSRYAYPSNMSFSIYTKYNGVKKYTDSALVSTTASGEGFGRAFDNSTSTKWAGYNFYAPPNSNIYNFDTGDIIKGSSESVTSDWWKENFGMHNIYVPFMVCLDVSSSPIDISTYTKWQFLNANDNASQTNRTWIEGEILCSVDKTKWYRLDIFNDTTIPNTNYAIAYTGNLIPRSGSIWSDLDLSTRDWTNGISVD